MSATHRSLAMSLLHDFICSLFQSNVLEYELTVYDDAYIESCVDEAIGTPNPFVCDWHVITIKEEK